MIIGPHRMVWKRPANLLKRAQAQLQRRDLPCYSFAVEALVNRTIVDVQPMFVLLSINGKSIHLSINPRTKRYFSITHTHAVFRSIDRLFHETFENTVRVERRESKADVIRLFNFSAAAMKAIRLCM